MSTLQALNSPDPGPLVQSLKASLASLTERAHTTLQWVPAHIGLSGNERADRLAKEGSRLTQPTTPATYEQTKTLLRSSFKREWANLNHGYQAHRDPIRTLERKKTNPDLPHAQGALWCPHAPKKDWSHSHCHMPVRSGRPDVSPHPARLPPV